jgi:hypothetical protein
MVLHDTFRDDPDDCDDENARTHQIAMIPPTHPNRAVNGSAVGDSLIFFVNYGLDPSSSRQNSWAGGVTLAHELGHNYERDHVNCPTGDPDDPDYSYPYPACQIDFVVFSSHVGFDPISGLLIAPDGGTDLMSYGHRLRDFSTPPGPILRWPSDYTWEGILSDMDTPPGAPVAAMESAAASSLLLVSGTLAAGSRSAVFDYAFPVEGSSLAKANALLAKEGSSSEFALWLLNATGGLIQQVPISILREAESPNGNWAFAALIDPASGPARVTVRDLVVPRELGTLSSGSGLPSVAILSPTAGEVVDMGEKVEIDWFADDTDGDALRFTVRYSPDMGSTWLPLAYQTPFSTLTRKTQGLSSCTDTCLIEVTASDGLHTATAVSDPFTVVANRPETAIFFDTAEQFGITGRAVVKQSDEVILRGRGYSAEDGPLAGANLLWLLEGPEVITGEGRRLRQRGLVPGEYAVKLTALASTGLNGFAYATLVVEPKSVPDASLPRLDGYCDDFAYNADHDPIALGKNAGDVTQLRMVHADGALFACFSGIPDSPSNYDTVGLRIDPDASGDTVAGPADLAVVVDENEILGLLEGDGAGDFTPIALPDTVDGRVIQNDGTWSAEFRIDETLFGGWGRLVRMQPYSLLDKISTVWPVASDEGSPATWGEVQLGIPRRVTIDISPGVSPNFVDPASNGVVWVAVLSTPQLDATGDVDVPSLGFGPGMATPQGSFSFDVNGDQMLDLVLGFAIPDTGIQNDTSEACLDGTLDLGASGFVACDAIIPECSPDTCDFDNDGTANVEDNCILVDNPDQSDMDGDDYGDLCDADLNNDGVANVKDLGVLANELGLADCGSGIKCLTDFDKDKDVDGEDVFFLISIGIGTLGPSGLVP